MVELTTDQYRTLGYKLAEEFDPNYNRPGMLAEVSDVTNRHKDTIVRLSAVLLEMIAETDRKPITGGYK